MFVERSEKEWLIKYTKYDLMGHRKKEDPENQLEDFLFLPHALHFFGLLF